MIKVNLLRNITSAQAVSVDPEISDVRRQSVIKLVVILGFPLMLWAYEYLHITDLNADLKAVQAKIAEIEKARAALGEAGPRIEKFTKEKIKIEEELEQVRTLARNRLREVKGLDSLQSLIPDGAWISRILIEGNSVALTGFSSTEAGLSAFMRRLEESPFFSQVDPKQTSQVKINDKLEAKKFEIEFKLGKQQ